MSARTVLVGEAAIRAAVGSELGSSNWFHVTAERIDDFAAATLDPACTYFAVSLSNMFLPQIVEVRGFALGVNYGTQTVQVGAPLRAGDRVRARATLQSVTDVRGGLQTEMLITFETLNESGPESGPQIEPGGATDQACVIESLSRWLNPEA